MSMFYSVPGVPRAKMERYAAVRKRNAREVLVYIRYLHVLVSVFVK